MSDPLDEARAKEVGERLGDRDKADVADAHVVCCAIEREAELLTTDRDDIESARRARRATSRWCPSDLSVCNLGKLTQA